MKPKPEVAFHFEEISLEEALNVVAAGDGIYAEVKQTLLDKLPQLSPTSAFAFGLPDGKEVPEDQRRGLCHAINICLRKGNLDWRVTYSGTRKLFICVPAKRRFYRKGSQVIGSDIPMPTKGPQSQDVIKFRTQVIELAKAGYGPSEIARQLNAKEGRVNAAYYRYVKGRVKRKKS